MTAQTVTAPRMLPVRRTVGACYAIVARNFGYLIRISWLWLLIMVPLYAAAYWLTWPWNAEHGQGKLVALAITALPNVIGLPALASIAVAWHRLVLRGEREAGAIYLRLDRVVWGYALILLVFLVLGLAPTACAAWLPGLPQRYGFGLDALAGLAITLLVLPRLSLVLPGLALGDRLSAAAAWRVTRGNTWRLAGALVLCDLLPFFVVFVLLFVVFDPRDIAETRASASAFGATFSSLYVLIITLDVTLLSLAYRYMVRRQDIGAGTTA